jgi:hypothetical protein
VGDRIAYNNIFYHKKNLKLLEYFIKTV